MQSVISKLRCVVDGSTAELPARGRLTVKNPADGSVLTELPDVDEAGVDIAVSAARRAFAKWSQIPPRDRAAMLLRLADAMEENLEELALLESLDVGKPLGDARGEVASAIDKYRFFAGACRALSTSAAGEYKPNITSIVRREPIGVVGAISPWNYPIGLTAWKIPPALAAGNTIVLKTSPEAPLSNLRLAELAAEILPPGVFNVVTGGAQTGAHIVAHPDVGMISFTGSTETGKLIMRDAAEGLKRVHLELGGKAPVILFPDADLKRFAEAFKWAAFRNSGQDCTAACRVYVPESQHDEVLDRVVAVADSVRVGNTSVEEVEMGPVISEKHRDRVEGFVARALETGHVELATGGKAIGETGYFFAPTVLTGARQRDEIVQREVFGPVVSVTTFTDVDEAIDLANGVVYGLAASVWTQDIDLATIAARHLRFGTVWVNDHGPTMAEIPFGGLKQSGSGTRDLSIAAIEEHTELKHVAITARRPE